MAANVTTLGGAPTATLLAANLPPFRTTAEGRTQLPNLQLSDTPFRHAITQFTDAHHIIDTDFDAFLADKGNGDRVTGYKTLDALSAPELNAVLHAFSAARRERLAAEERNRMDPFYTHVPMGREVAARVPPNTAPEYTQVVSTRAQGAGVQGNLPTRQEPTITGQVHPEIQPPVVPRLTLAPTATRPQDFSVQALTEGTGSNLVDPVKLCRLCERLAGDVGTVYDTLRTNDQGMQAMVRTVAGLCTSNAATQAQLNRMMHMVHNLGAKLDELMAGAYEFGDSGGVEPMEEGEEPNLPADPPALPSKPTTPLPSNFTWEPLGQDWYVSDLTTRQLMTFPAFTARVLGGPAQPAAAPEPAQSVHVPYAQGAAQVSHTHSKPLTPPSFSGEGADVDPELALMSMELWLLGTQIPKEEWGRHVINILRGAALQAYSAIALPLHRASLPPPSWDQVKGLIMSFKRHDSATVARAKLLAIRQTGTVAAYNQLFTRLLAQVGPDPPSATDLLNAYLKGLLADVVHPLSPAGLPWESLQAAQSFHLTRELAHLQLQSRVARTDRFAPTRPLTPRLKGAQVAGGRGSGSGSGRGGQGGGSGRGSGSGSGRGGQGRGGFRGFHNASNAGALTPAKRAEVTGGFGATAPTHRPWGNKPNAGSNGSTDAAFGTSDAAFKANLDAPCPKHTDARNPHTKRECRDYRNLASERYLRA